MALQRSTVAPAPAASTAGKRKTGPTGDDQPEQKGPRKRSRYPNRKTLQEITYYELAAPPFITKHDPEYFPIKVDGKDYFWLVSEKAQAYFDKLSDAAENCCTQKWGVCIYNDFTGYGEIELLENMVNAFEKEWKKVRGRKSEELFWRAEALAIFLFRGSDWCEWIMCGDCERVSALRHLIASIFLETFFLLKKDNLLTPDSPLKNIGFVAALIANCGYVNKRKPRKVLNLCEDAGIAVALGPKEFEYDDGVDLGEFAAVDDNDYDDDEFSDIDSEVGSEEEEEENGGFKKALRHYKLNVGTDKLGGNEFNLSRWRRAELKSYSLDNACNPSLCHR